jgi:pimeloyl-ACP methyl ester carboxylesterase
MTVSDLFPISHRIIVRFAATLFLFAMFAIASPAHAGYLLQHLTFPAGRVVIVGKTVQSEYRINVDSYMKKGPCGSHSRHVFMVHGFGDNARLFEPLAAALLESGKACRVMAIDLPTHGASQVSSQAYFDRDIWGEIGVVDYAKVVDQVLGEIEDAGSPVDTIVGHSTGGLIVQWIQAKYAAENASLASRFGIERTILIASDIPGALPWAAGDAPIAAGLAKGLTVAFAKTDPDPIGTRVFLDYNLYIALKFSAAGVPVPSAPDAAAALELNEPEPYAAAANIVGLDPTGDTQDDRPRLDIPPGLWSGYDLKVVWPDQDDFFVQSEDEALADYLKPGTHAIVVSDPEAVHAVQYAKPELLLPFF